MKRILKFFAILVALIMVIDILPVTAFSEASTFTFTVGNTVVGTASEKESAEFAYIGKIQCGFHRPAVSGDTWYGTSDVVYEGLRIYTAGISYVKTDTESGSTVASGTMTPNGYGMFHFNLKDHESITFTVTNLGNMGFYLYETPTDTFSTSAVCNGTTFSGTVNVMTGESVGVGAVPGGMETRYYEKNDLNMSKEYAPILYPLNGDVNIQYTNTGTVIPETYNCSYSFTSQTAGQSLPSEVMNLLPGEQANIADGTEVTPEHPASSEVLVSGGKWIFQGYSQTSLIIHAADVSFEGFWLFEPDPIPETYRVSYRFVSRTEGKTLPAEVMNLLPSELTDLPDGTGVTPDDPKQKEVALSEGRWIFGGYNLLSATISGGNLLFEGYWTFEEPTASETGGAVIGDRIDTETEIESTGTDEESGTAESSAETEEEKEETVSVSGEDPSEETVTETQEETVTESEEFSEIETPEENPPGKKINFRFWRRVIVILVLGIVQLALSIGISSDIHILQWYGRKKKAFEEEE